MSVVRVWLMALAVMLGIFSATGAWAQDAAAAKPDPAFAPGATAAMAMPATSADQPDPLDDARDTPSEPQPYATTCGQHYADWQSGLAGEYTLRVTGRQIAVPAGTNTTIFQCRVAGHSVRMNFAYIPVGTYHCGATTDAQISVWVDGVKVVSRREWGDANYCFNSDDDRALARVIINDRMHMTLCTRHLNAAYQPHRGLRTGQSDEIAGSAKDGKSYFLRECTVETLALPADGRPEQITRTPPGLELISDGSPICRPAAALMAYLPGDNGTDISFQGHDVTGTGDYTGPSDDELATLGAGLRYEKPFMVDIDNDGQIDTLTFLSSRDKEDDGVPWQYKWTSGANGQTYAITATLLGDVYGMGTGTWADPVFSTLRFISLGGRQYVYLAHAGQVNAFATDVFDYERWSGAFEGGYGPASRALYELRPNGTAKAVCEWAPRPRPEEFL